MNDRYGTFEQVNGGVVNDLDREIEQLQKDKAELVEIFYSVYSGINHLMGALGAQGEISTRESVSSDMMGILYDFDGGVFIQDKERFLKAIANKHNSIGEDDE